MNDLPTSDVRFEGLGATAGSAAEASRTLSTKLNHWAADHPNCRILQLSVQSTARGDSVELAAILAYIEEESLTQIVAAAEVEVSEGETSVISQAEEIIADVQERP